jgi:hypothetical protein
VAAGDRFLPSADLSVTELVLVAAGEGATYAAIGAADVSSDRLLGVMGALTDLHQRLGEAEVQPRKLGALLGPELGFVTLAEEPDRLRVVGLAARYSPLDRRVERLEPERFASFAEPGYVKAVIGFSLHAQGADRTLLTCDARARATDEDTRSALTATSFAVVPALRLLCRRLLELVKQQAESGVQPGGGGDGDREQRDADRLSAG